jgi:butyrate kinase
MSINPTGPLTQYRESINELQEDLPTLLNLREETGTSTSLALLDAGGVLEMNNAAANTVTIEPDSTTDIPIRSTVDIVQLGAGSTSLVAGSGVTILGELNLAGQYKAISIYKKAVNTWVAIGGI